MVRGWRAVRPAWLSGAAVLVIATTMLGFFGSQGVVPADGVAGSLISDTNTSVPNYFYKDSTDFGYLGAQASESSLVVDPANHYLFETNPSASLPQSWSVSNECAADNMVTPWYRLNYDDGTFDVSAKGCGGGDLTNAQGTGPSNAPFYALDSTDGLLFFENYKGATFQGESTRSDAIVAVSESTLEPVAQWSLPGPGLGPTLGATADGTGADQATYGLSWNAESDQLVVVTALDHNTTDGTAALPGTVVLLAYDLGGSGIGNGQAPPLAWSFAMPSQCSQGLGAYSDFGSADAYESQSSPYLFAPCAQTIAGGGQAGGAVIFRLDLSKVGGTPTGSFVETEVPGQSTDFYFDPGSDRGFMPTDTSAGSSLMVYDGDLPSFVGQVGVSSAPAGGVNPNFNCNTFGVDSTTGRIYALGPAGLVDADGRAPNFAATAYPSLAGDPFEHGYTAVVLPPDKAQPLARVALGRFFSGSAVADVSGCGEAHGYLPSFGVFTDASTPAPAPSAPSAVDENTLTSTPPPGSTITSTYSGTAEAAGLREVWTGSYGGAVNTTDSNGFSNLGIDGTTLPLGGGIRDLLAGWVQQAKLINSSTYGTADALGDGNGTTGAGLAQCTDVQAVVGCSGQNGNRTLATAISGLQQASAVGPNYSQQWPAPMVSCSQPGPQEQQDVKETGLYATTGYNNDSGTPEAQTQQIDNSQNAAGAEANCASGTNADSVFVNSLLQGPSLQGASGAPTVTVAYTQGTGNVVPATSSKGVTATASAIAKGIEINLPGVTIDIGEVLQTASATAAGVKGSALGEDSVQIADVSFSNSSGTTVLCQKTTTCTPSSIAQLNQIDPSYFQVALADPNSPFGSSGSFPGTEKINGSPGGYLGVVEATRAQQAYDSTFDGIPASDGEAAMLPGLRLTIYYDSTPNGSAYGRDREVLDLAPVEVDAEDGLSAVPPDVVLPGQQPGACDSQCEVLGASTAQFIPGTPAQYVPGTAGYYLNPQNSALSVPPSAGASGLLPAIRQFFKRVLNGIGLLLRSPAVALKFFGLLLLLSLPVVVMIRRDEWLKSVLGNTP